MQNITNPPNPPMSEFIINSIQLLVFSVTSLVRYNIPVKNATTPVEYQISNISVIKTQSPQSRRAICEPVAAFRY